MGLGSRGCHVGGKGSVSRWLIVIMWWGFRFGIAVVVACIAGVNCFVIVVLG